MTLVKLNWIERKTLDWWEYHNIDTTVMSLYELQRYEASKNTLSDFISSPFYLVGMLMLFRKIRKQEGEPEIE